MNETIYCVTFHNENEGEDQTLKLTNKEEAIAVAKVISSLVSYSNEVKVLEGEPKVIWSSD